MLETVGPEPPSASFRSLTAVHWSEWLTLTALCQVKNGLAEAKVNKARVKRESPKRARANSIYGWCIKSKKTFNLHLLERLETSLQCALLVLLVASWM